MAVDLSEITELEQLITLMRAAGVERLLFKRLSPNDNSKNQIYLGGNYSALQDLPFSDIIADTSSDGSKNDRFKATIQLQWMDENGELFNAPNSQLILYPSYPEVRLSGFLSNAAKRPSRLLGSREQGRILFLGITADGRVVGHAIGVDNPLRKELEKFEDNGGRGVLIEVPMDQVGLARNTPFRPRARLLQLLGDQLIGSDKLAIFELVKNAYDADASKVTVTLHDLKSENPYIVVKDDGTGMSRETILNVWMVPADDFREKQREELTRSEKFKRLPLGEKGVGRFAVHKLGDEIIMITRAEGYLECRTKISWPEQLENKFLDETNIITKERKAQWFKGKKTGTAIKISKLRQKTWARGDVRRLYRQLMSISSPFKKYDDGFEVVLNVPDYPEWVSEIPDAEDLLRKAPWHYKFKFDGNTFKFSYKFKGVPGIKVDKRNSNRADIPLQISKIISSPESAVGKQKKLLADEATLDGIGSVEGEFYVFDRDRIIMSKYGDTQQLTDYLDQNGGIRVYRDGIRVYNYGEEGDDWLGLDLRRVNSPVRKLSRNIVIGTIDLSLEESHFLKEKTNREGFVENDALKRLKSVILGALAQLEVERFKDKQNLRAVTGTSKNPPKDLKSPVAKIRKIAAKHKITSETEPILLKIEKDYDNLRDNFLRAGLSQVGLGLVFHEIERGMDVLYDAIKGGIDLSEISRQASELRKILEISTQLLKKGDKATHSLRKLIKRARDLSSVRFRVHKVELECPALEEGSIDEDSVFAFGLALGALTNLIDNAVHWLKIAHPEGAVTRKVYLDLIPDYPQGPAIIVADNGTGYLDNTEELIQPFFSRRPDGMGLGLHYANMVMQLNDGALIFPTKDEFEIPTAYDGAVVALVFKAV